jgi:hypothetical protein
VPILGTLASQFSGKPFSSFESIQTVTVGSGGASEVEFTSIPSTYTHLQIRAIVRSNRNTGDALNVRFNSDTSSSYARHGLYGNGSSTGASGGSSETAIEAWSNIADNSMTASVFTGGIMDILDYANTNKYKTVRSLQGNDVNGSGHIYLASGLWTNTSAITSIKFYVAYGTGVMQYTQFALYGIKGA